MKIMKKILAMLVLCVVWTASAVAQQNVPENDAVQNGKWNAAWPCFHLSDPASKVAILYLHGSGSLKGTQVSIMLPRDMKSAGKYEPRGAFVSENFQGEIPMELTAPNGIKLTVKGSTIADGIYDGKLTKEAEGKYVFEGDIIYEGDVIDRFRFEGEAVEVPSKQKIR